MMYDIFTDGSCLGNPGPGGWAALIRNMDDGTERVISGNNPQTTNNQMEITGILEAIKYIHSFDTESQVRVYSDSNYCVKAINEWLVGWIKTNFAGKKNVSLWQDYIYHSKGMKVQAIWIKAHNKHPENEFVDAIAYNAARECTPSPRKEMPHG